LVDEQEEAVAEQPSQVEAVEVDRQPEREPQSPDRLRPQPAEGRVSGPGGRSGFYLAPLERREAILAWRTCRSWA
jgi:hypothetical protein